MKSTGVRNYHEEEAAVECATCKGALPLVKENHSRVKPSGKITLRRLHMRKHTFLESYKKTHMIFILKSLALQQLGSSSFSTSFFI